jgi:hypothetical protein
MLCSSKTEHLVYLVCRTTDVDFKVIAYNLKTGETQKLYSSVCFKDIALSHDESALFIATTLKVTTVDLDSLAHAS